MTTNLLTLIRIAGLPDPEAEYPFHSERAWRFDWAWPERKLAIEQEGGTWKGGRHNRPKGYAEDCDKYNEAALLGWRVLRFTADQIKDGRALRVLRMIRGAFEA